MHALDRVARATGQPLFATWARELAVAAHRGFTCAPGPGAGPGAGTSRRMYWKMSIDLSRPVVPSMGHHDPLDGLVTCLELEAGGAALPALAEARADFAAMIEPDRLSTADPLGLGGLLIDASRLERAARDPVARARVDPTGLRPAPPATPVGSPPHDAHSLVDAMLAAAHAGLRHYIEQPDRRLPAAHRLAFRELGLAIGLGAAAAMQQRAAQDRPEASEATRRRISQIVHYLPLRAEIEAFWQEPAHRAAESWRAHEDINGVMLATSLLPDAFVG